MTALRAKLCVAPIAWSNDDLPELGGDAPLATLTRNSAFSLLRNRIRVNQLNIGWMSSDGEDWIQREYHGAGDDWLAEASAAQPFGRLVAPEEVARAVTFLASADSGLMTGSVVNFDQSVWGAYAGFGRLRVSTHLYNDSSDVDRFIDALEQTR